MEEESVSGTILSKEKAFWQGVADHESAQERESCDEGLRFLRTRRSRTRCPTTKWVKAKDKVAQKVESIFKKPHRAAGELSERKFEAENTAQKKEVSVKNNQVKAEVQSEEVELKRNEMEKSSDKVQEMVLKMKVEMRLDSNGATDAMVAKALCRAKVGTRANLAVEIPAGCTSC